MPKHFYLIINLLAIAALTFIGVDIFYRVVRNQLWQVHSQDVSASRSSADERLERQSDRGYQAIIDRNLFGALEGKETEQPLIELVNLEPTSLQLSLLGTIAGDDDAGRAIIGDRKQRTQDLYRVGDDIQGAVVKRILRGKVILRVNGRDEILTMEENTEAGKKSASVSSPRSRSRSRTSRTTSRRNRETLTLSRHEIEESLDNIGDVLSQVRVQPHMEDGEAQGLMVSEISADSIFQRMGLLDGDVVQAVNNKDIRSPDDVVSLYQSLKSGSRLNLQVTRDGQQKILNYRIR